MLSPCTDPFVGEDAEGAGVPPAIPDLHGVPQPALEGHANLLEDGGRSRIACRHDAMKRAQFEHDFDQSRRGATPNRNSYGKSPGREINRAGTWTFQRFSASIDVGLMQGKGLQLDGGSRPGPSWSLLLNLGAESRYDRRREDSSRVQLNSCESRPGPGHLTKSARYWILGQFGGEDSS